jgi:NADH-quinone oxidoreductase subunit F
MQFPAELEQKFQTLLGRYPRKRSALVPMALYAQDVFGLVSDELIAEIAKRLDLNTLQVTETIEYYTMLRRKPAGRNHVQICTNVSCKLRGADKLWEFAQRKLEIGNKQTSADGLFSLEEVECIGACTGAPAMQVNYDFYENLTPEKFEGIIARLDRGERPPSVRPASGSLHPRHPAEVPVISRLFGVENSHTLAVYLQNDGYKGLEKALSMTPDQVIEEVKKSNLRGRGGAGFPTGMKWSFVPKESAKGKYILANCDESEPGTCKDRPLLEMVPHQLIEGMIIAAYAVGAHNGYAYVRGEYRYVLDIVEGAIAEAYANGYLGKNIMGSKFCFDLAAHTGAGSYECGEESALMESLEGKRGYPRIRPPFPAVVGLYGAPTVINNAETLSSVPAILRRGGEWYASLGTPKNGGTRLYSISGHVNRPGIYELPMGFSFTRFIEEVAGGIAGGRKLKAVIPGGSSCPVLKAEEIEGLAMDYDSVAKAGSMLGSGGTIIIDEQTCMVDLCRRIMHFYAHESCGWCIPCREGTAWLRKLLDRIHDGGGRPEDLPMVGELAKNMLGRTFCPLGDAAALPTMSIAKKWPEEFQEHLSGKCPYKPADVLAEAL